MVNSERLMVLLSLMFETTEDAIHNIDPANAPDSVGLDIAKYISRAIRRIFEKMREDKVQLSDTAVILLLHNQTRLLKTLPPRGQDSGRISEEVLLQVFDMLDGTVDILTDAWGPSEGAAAWVEKELLGGEYSSLLKRARGVVEN